jgi:hypothetical protein
MAASLEQVLERTLAVLPVTKEELIARGIATEVTERFIGLKRVTARLKERYGSLSALEKRVKQEGVSPNDHTLYTDLLEWRAAENEIDELLTILGTM